MYNILAIDMHIRDERVLAWILEQRKSEMQIKASTIAKVFKCHENTAIRILNRLEGAEKISVVAKTYRGGFVYKVLANA